MDPKDYGMTDSDRAGAGHPSQDHWHTGASLASELLSDQQTWGYRVLICADEVLPPSPWTDRFRVEFDHKHKVIRICGSLT